ncbi:acetyl-CoA carboxylase biotin carboxylase subunit family protein [uncultured Psychroserpens sp.]|uniref:ATP-grasp domain-containing protein n=1 Tax=uncultured Psychroserpens sp. TaxID=255436 RepID=UPI0026178075|nr:ATP-grasp domain-containing protein [uncultured Psychroserpens sp.]
MKRILLLGGSDLQVSFIKKAKALGVYVITCDYLPNNPGHQFADEYYNVSTTDKEAVLNLASKLNLDGISAYASDPAATTAACVGEHLGLPVNPYNAVEILSRKDLFRQFLEKHNFNTPEASDFNDYQSAKTFIDQLQKKAIIKPVDSSGSKGIFTIVPNQNFENEFESALGFSRCGKVIVEEFIEKQGFQIGGDGFLVNGELVFRCFGDIHFSSTNPLLPCSVSVPTLHTKDITDKVHREIQRLMTLLGMKQGGLNFDIIIDSDNQIHIIEIGPRNGGNMLPELIEHCTGVDMKLYAIKSCLGEDCSDLRMTSEKHYFSHYVVHSLESGVLQGIETSETLKNHLIYEHYRVGNGDPINRFENSSNRLGMFLLKYNNKDEMLDIIDNMHEHLKFQFNES